MGKHNINRWIFEIPLGDVQVEKEIKITGKPQCLLCGKLISGKTTNYVHLLNNGMLVSSDEDFENSLGLFEVGNECKNRLPNNFIFSNK